MYRQLSAAQLENELQNSSVKFQSAVEIIAIVISNVTAVENTSLLDSFPPDLFTGTDKRSKYNRSLKSKKSSYTFEFTDNERLDGAIIFHISAATYFFVLLAVVCHDYFLPSVECICDDLNISKVILF